MKVSKIIFLYTLLLILQSCSESKNNDQAFIAISDSPGKYEINYNPIETGEKDKSIAAIPYYNVVKVRINNTKLLEAIVSLKKKVSEKELSLISSKVKKELNSASMQARIDYILPGMQPENGAWAIARFNPDLHIDYISTSKEDERFILENTQGKNFVGMWDYGSDVMMVIKKTVNEYSFEYVSTTNVNETGPITYKLKKVLRKGKEYYIETEDNSKFYYVVAKNGDLMIYNEDGLQSTFKPIR